MNKSSQTRVSRRRVGGNTAAAILAAVVLAGLAHYLAARHYVRADWSRSGFYRLSPRTTSLLAQITNRVDITLFFQPGHDLFPHLDRLLKEYRDAAPDLRVDRVDPERDIARAKELAQELQLTEANVLVVRAAGRLRTLPAGELADYDRRGLTRGERPKMAAFRGEQALSSAMHALVFGRDPVVYALRGHGEKDLDDYTRLQGLSDLARELRRDGITPRPLQLGEARRIPADADALLIAGPTKPFAQPELDELQRYLDANGRALLLLDARAQTGLETLLRRWQVAVGQDLVVDSARTLTGRELFVTRYERHPITARLGHLTTIFYLPRSVQALPGAPGPRTTDQPRVTELALCSETGWAERRPEERPIRFDPDTDQPGPVAVAAAVEKGIKGLDVGIRPSRLVVVGDAAMSANGAMTAANRDFLFAALNWLIDREELLDVLPRAVTETQLTLTAGRRRALAILLLGALPGAALLLGWPIWWRRRWS